MTDKEENKTNIPTPLIVLGVVILLVTVLGVYAHTVGIVQNRANTTMVGYQYPITKEYYPKENVTCFITRQDGISCLEGQK